MGSRLLRSRELGDRLPGRAKARRWTAVKGGEAVPEGREDRRRSVSGAEDRSALEGWPAVGYSVVSVNACSCLDGSADRAPWVGSDGHSGSLTITHQSGRGHAGGPDAGHLFVLGAHGGVRPQPGGFNHFLDVATEVGVMPLHELAPWLCPIRLIRPPGLARGTGCVHRAGRRRP